MVLRLSAMIKAFAHGGTASNDARPLSGRDVPPVPGCHIELDWPFIYRIDEEGLVLVAMRARNQRSCWSFRKRKINN